MEQEILVDPNQSFVDDIFSISNIRRCERRIFSLQSKLDKAVADNDTPSIRETFNLLGKNSKASKVLAVYRITQRNQGKYTAGVDGISIPKEGRDLQYKTRLELLNEIDIVRKPDPIKRVFIPKPNGKTRPLGIPTIRDRINQEILRIATEPIVEYHFNHNSWGFRPKRRCQDAIEQLFNKLSKNGSPQYIVEGDIKGCFDNIDHEHIVKTLSNWKVPIWALELTLKMLKSNIFHNGEVYDNETGTPQGGVISPLLANVALTSLDNFCFKLYGSASYGNGRKYKNNPIVRYADDFVIICKQYRIAQQVKKEISEHLSEYGLTLSDSKTNITHITTGFNFLGFNIRKYPDRETYKKAKSCRKWENHKLLIKPQKEKVVQLLDSCGKVLTANKTAKQDSVISILNPKLNGWAMYYRFVVSKEIFNTIDYHLWWKLFSWAERRHSNKSRGWIINRYFSRVESLKKVFSDNKTETHIFRLSTIPIKRFVRLNNKYRVFENSLESREYWEKREVKNAFNQIFSVKVSMLFNKQQGTCVYCHDLITKEQVANREIHAHHTLPRSFGGSDSHSNLKLLHQECHRELHTKFSREKMYTLTKEGLDYTKSYSGT